MFDWVTFLDAHGVEYVTSGPNVSRGEVGVRCPFCGDADPSQHMSISLTGRGWVCRRDRQAHRGRAPATLVRALIGCSPERARQIVGAPTALPVDGLAQVEALMTPPPVDVAPTRLHPLPTFRHLGTSLPSERPYAAYLAARGVSRAFLARRGRRVGLRYCVHGSFAGRVVFLVRRDGRLVNWTARAISRRAVPRYKTLSADAETAAEAGLPPALVPIEQCLLWYDDWRRGGDLLYVVEGPMDALKLRVLGRRATCLFTSSASTTQVGLLHDLARVHDRVVVLLDAGADAQAQDLVATLAALKPDVWRLPAGVDDPGELTRATLRELEDANL